ncbi:hypothetical protein ACTXT7_016730 [Hymenolepis weldensis]
MEEFDRISASTAKPIKDQINGIDFSHLEQKGQPNARAYTRLVPRVTPSNTSRSRFSDDLTPIRTFSRPTYLRAPPHLCKTEFQLTIFRNLELHVDLRLDSAGCTKIDCSLIRSIIFSTDLTFDHRVDNGSLILAKIALFYNY